MTTSVNESVSLSENLFESLVWGPLVEALVASLKTEVPAFSVWPLSNIFDPSVSALSNYIFNKIKLIIDVTSIQLINDEHQSAYDAASLKLAIIAHDKGIESDEFKTARDAAKAALSKFVRFNV